MFWDESIVFFIKSFLCHQHKLSCRWYKEFLYIMDQKCFFLMEYFFNLKEGFSINFQDRIANIKLIKTEIVNAIIPSP